MARRGRPPGTDSGETRQRILDTARREFSNRGYASTAVTSIAAKAGLAPSAIYHYFGGKRELYEAVFEVSVGRIWSRLETELTGSGGTFLDAVDQVLAGSAAGGVDPFGDSDFLAMVPTEARLHPEFAHLLDRRSKYQDSAFGALVDLGIETGALRDLDRSTAVEMVRSAIMGSFFERHFRPELRADSIRATRELLRRMAS